VDRSRSELLLGKEAIEILANAKGIIFGIGGVGGSAFEALIRHGIQNLTIIDFDVVDSSNLNRQVLYTSNDLGKLKVICARERALTVNPAAKITIISDKITPATTLDFSDYDFVVDAIDDVKAKIHIIKECLNSNSIFVSSLGMGNRLDPSQISLTTLNKTENDPLARVIRVELRKQNLELRNVTVVFSKESPIRREKPIGSTYIVPNTAGIHIASLIVKKLIEKEEENGKN